jgi:hypothetical protein
MGRIEETVMLHLRAFVGCVALCAALGTAATTATTLAGHAPNIRQRAGTSTNWSGYSVTGAAGTFQNVSGTWVQPQVTCTSQTTYSAFWVGIDGDGTSTVEQLGTEADCVGGQARYSSWYEMYPHRSYSTPVTVVPKHTYAASVVSLGSGNFRLSLQDVTANGPVFTTVQKLNQANLGSAEAIAEAPSGGGVLPLSNFGTAQFSNVTVNGQKMASPPAGIITMVNSSGGIKAQPSALNNGAFSITWKSST